MTDRLDRAVKITMLFWLLVFVIGFLWMYSGRLFVPTMLEVNWTCLSSPAASLLLDSCSVGTTVIKTDAVFSHLLIYVLATSLWLVQFMAVVFTSMAGMHLLLGLEWR
jgi:hypothetical protein